MKYVAYFILILSTLALPACKKERCLKCTTAVSGVETVHPEICDTDKDVLNAQEEKYQQLVDEFVRMGWNATINCVRQ